jgi:tetratricopeptide (TPR) repeat protein
LLAQLEETTRPESRISLWIGLADNYFKLREFDRSIEYRKMVLEALPKENVEDRLWQLEELVKGLLFWGERNLVRGDIEEARSQFEEAIAALPENQFWKLRANALTSLGDLEVLENMDSAKLFYEEAVLLYNTEADTKGLAHVLLRLGNLNLRQKNFDSARSMYLEAIENFKIASSSIGIAISLGSLGELESRLGNIDTARTLFGEATEYLNTERDIHELANIKLDLAVLELKEGDDQQAFSLVNESVRLFMTTGDALSIAKALGVMAFILHWEEKYETRDQVFANAMKYATASNTPSVVQFVENIGNEWIPKS